MSTKGMRKRSCARCGMIRLLKGGVCARCRRKKVK